MNRNDPAPSIWLVENLPRKIAKGSIDRQLIAVTAARMLDENGLDDLTMRGLGHRLGVSAMACYAHVRHKDDVLELAQDHTMGLLHVRDGTWERILRRLAQDYRRLLIDHPWLPSLAGRFLNAGPNVTTLTRDVAQRLTSARLHAAIVPSALSAVFTLAHGHGVIEAAWKTRLNDATLDDLVGQLSDQSPEDPVLARRATHGSAAAGDDDWNFALDCLLAGIAAHSVHGPTSAGDA